MGIDVEDNDEVFREIVEALEERTGAQGVLVLLLHKVRVGQEVDLLGESYVAMKPRSGVDEATFLMAAISGLSAMIDETRWQEVIAAMKEETLHRAREVQIKSAGETGRKVVH